MCSPARLRRLRDPLLPTPAAVMVLVVSIAAMMIVVLLLLIVIALVLPTVSPRALCIFPQLFCRYCLHTPNDLNAIEV
jgi:hypothetical protein